MMTEIVSKTHASTDKVPPNSMTPIGVVND